jgi:hypothetical protein
MQNYFGTEPELDIASTIRRGLLGMGTDSGASKVQPKMPQEKPPSAIDNLLNMAKPMTPKEQSIAEHGKGGHIARSIGGFLLGDSDMFTKDAYKDQYKTDSARYKASSAIRENMPAFREYDAMLRDSDPGNDAEALYMMNKTFGADDKLMKQMYGEYTDRGEPKAAKPSWEKIDIDGQYFYADKNDPTAAPVPVTMEDGTFAYSDLSEGQAKNVNYFERGAPRIMQMHRMEDAGVTLPRAVLQAVARAENTQTGFIDQAVFAQLLNKIGLDPEQREYLDAATDFSMVNLRKDSGAAISASEMIKELKNTVMLDDMSPSHYKENREARRTRATALIAGMPKRVRAKYKDKLENINGLSLDKVIAETEGEGESYGILKEDANGWTPPTLDEIMGR